MHSLEVIISKNAKAAGREAGHAVNDGDHETAKKIAAAALEDEIVLVNYSKTFLAGYWRGRKEG